MLILIPASSYALGPNDWSCYELGTCNIFENPVEVITKPFTETLGDFAYPVVWGLILFIIWLRVQNTMIVGIIGIMLSLFVTFGTDAQSIGAALLMASIGIAIYQLITTRIHYPQN